MLVVRNNIEVHFPIYEVHHLHKGEAGGNDIFVTKDPMTLMTSSTRISRLISSVTRTELTFNQINWPRSEGVRIHFSYRSRMKKSPFTCFFGVSTVIITVKETLDKELIIP